MIDRAIREAESSLKAMRTRHEITSVADRRSWVGPGCATGERPADNYEDYRNCDTGVKAEHDIAGQSVPLVFRSASLKLLRLTLGLNEIDRFPRLSRTGFYRRMPEQRSELLKMAYERGMQLVFDVVDRSLVVNFRGCVSASC